VITHNMLKCNVRGVENGYPLIIESTQTDVIPCEFNKEMVEKVLQKTQLAALRSAAANLGVASKLLAGEEGAETPSLQELLGDEEALRELHHLLFEVHVTEGFLVCPESGRRFPVKEGIPNMLLHEDEV